MLTNMTELFDSELREAQRLDFGNRKRGSADGVNSVSGIWSKSCTTADRIAGV